MKQPAELVKEVDHPNPTPGPVGEASLTDEEQFALINNRQWYTDMRTQTSKIIQAMQSNTFQVQGTDAHIITEVNGVAVRFQVQGQDVYAQVAQQEDGSWMYEWTFPIGWVLPGAPEPATIEESKTTKERRR